MNFLYFPLFCVFFPPTRGHVTLTLLCYPGASDKLDLRIDGSIELGSDWPHPALGKVISKLGQSLRQNGRGVNENNPKISGYTTDWFDSRQIKFDDNDRLQKNVDNKLHKQDGVKFIRHDDRAVNENNPKISGYTTDWFDTRQITYEDNDRLQKHVDNKLHKQDGVKFIRHDDRAVNENNPKDSDYTKDWFDTRQIKYEDEDNGRLQKHVDNKLHKPNDFKVLRQNDRAVTENSPKNSDYTKDWFDTRQIKYEDEDNGQLQKHLDNKLHKQDEFKFIRQDDRGVNDNPKIPGYTKDWFDSSQIINTDVDNNDGFQKHEHDKLHKEDDFKFTGNTQHDRHDKLHKHDDFKFPNNDWIQQHKDDTLHKEDNDFKFPDNDWIQQHKYDTLHKEDDFKFTDNIQQHKHDTLHKEDDFKFTDNIQQHKHDKLHKKDDFKFTDNIQQHKHDTLHKEDDFKFPINDLIQPYKGDKLHKEDDFKFTDNIQQHKHDTLHKEDDFKFPINDLIQPYEGDKLHKEDDFKFTDNIQQHKHDTLHKEDDFKFTDNIQQHKHDKLHKEDDFKFPINDLMQPFKGDKLHKEDDFKFPANDWIQEHKFDKFTNNTQQYRHGKLHKYDYLRNKIGIGSDNNDDKISVHWDPDKFDFYDDNETSEKSDKKANPRRKRQKDGIVGVTQFERTKTTDHKVKDDERTKEFSVHMFKQTMQVFDSMKRKMGNDVMKAKVDEMARNYKDQFGDFVRQQRENSVRTKMGDQRAILHTMDTSNLILQRLVNFLKADLEKANIERSHDNILQREVDTARKLEYQHVCAKYGYCRSDKGFTNMLQNCIKILISVDDEKMYRARDALTEVLKTGDFGKLIDSKTDKTFKKKINRMEKKEPEDLREALRVLLGMLQNLQTPLEDEGGNSEVVKKTAAFYTLLAMWEDAMPGDESNKLEWTDIERSLGDWRDGKRTDIHEIFKALERNVNRGLKKIDPDTEVKMKEQVKIIRG